jgi:dsDNA-specific endonuclease/ATPase MutS2
VLSIKELLNIADTLRAVRVVKEWRANCLSVENTSIEELFYSLIPNKYLEDKINFAIKNEE